MKNYYKVYNIELKKLNSGMLLGLSSSQIFFALGKCLGKS